MDWAAVLPAGQRVDLPTYAFQHQRFWPKPVLAPPGDAGSLGLNAMGHPLLGAAVELAGGDGYLLTGRVSVRSQPWLADHAVGGTILLPGTAFAEMAIAAGDAAGCGRIEELALEAPLALAADGAVQLQVTVGAPDERGCRSVRVYARAEQAEAREPWRRHASGLLAPAMPPEASLAGEFAVWPPEGAEPLAVDGLYDGLAAGGTATGPRSAGCGRRGVVVRMCSPTCRCRPRRWVLRTRSAFIRPCWTRPCTPSGWSRRPRALRRRAPDRCGCRSRGPTWPCTRRARPPSGSGCGTRRAARCRWRRPTVRAGRR